jgi:hypothetical protein
MSLAVRRGFSKVPTEYRVLAELHPSCRSGGPVFLAESQHPARNLANESVEGLGVQIRHATCLFTVDESAVLLTFHFRERKLLRSTEYCRLQILVGRGCAMPPSQGQTSDLLCRQRHDLAGLGPATPRRSQAG